MQVFECCVPPGCFYVQFEAAERWACPTGPGAEVEHGGGWAPLLQPHASAGIAVPLTPDPAASLGMLRCSAVRGLSNYMFHEAQRLAKEEVQKGHDKFDG